MSRALYSSVAAFLLLLSLSVVSAYTFSDFNDGTESILGKDIGTQFSQVNTALLKSGESQSFEYVVVAYVMLIVMFSILFSAAKVLPFFEGRSFMAFIVAICATGLISLSGTIDTTTQAVLAFRANPSVDGWSSLALFILLVLIVAVAAILNAVASKIKRLTAKDAARDEGFKLGSDVEIARMYSSIFKKE